jgi:hypothetical protein
MTTESKTASSRKADKGNWDEDFAPRPETEKKEGPNGKLPYVKFDKDGDYRFRLVGPHVKYYKHWKPIVAITHPDYKQDDPAWKAGFWPPKRFCIHVIDRADGKLKLLDKGNSVFKTFASFMTVNKINPAGKDAPDFVIKVTIPKKNGKPDPRNASYEVVAAHGNSPLTPEEVKLYTDNKVDLLSIYQTTPLEKIHELWDAVSDEDKIPPKKDENSSYSNGKTGKKPAAQEKAPEPEKAQVSVPATEISDSADSELFEDDGAESTGTKTASPAELW